MRVQAAVVCFAAAAVLATAASGADADEDASCPSKSEMAAAKKAKEAKEKEKEGGGCGCSGGGRDAKLAKGGEGSGAREATTAETAAGVEALVVDAGATEYKNASETVCKDGAVFYEGYRKGCFHWYHDEYTGREDCGEVRISGGTFLMGQEFKGDAKMKFGANDPGLEVRYKYNTIHGVNPSDAEQPVVKTKVKSFHIDRCEVSNAQFREFIEAKQYITDAEVYNWSFVLEAYLSPEVLAGDPALVPRAPWWRSIEGASWRHPEGPGSSLDTLARWHADKTDGVPDQPAGTRWSHPASHVSWRDAYNFCRWRGKRLPTEAEWEYAAKGGHAKRIFPWGNRLYENETHWQNVWQGDLRGLVNTAEDGYRGTSPSASYPPNAFGLYDMTGNIWEWVQDDFDRGEKQETQERNDAKGTSTSSPRVSHKTKKGGSHMCHAATCNRYRSAGRTGIEADSSAANLGFRCARDV
eukprot:Rhum_TRINITY_DN2162_c0_g1::Rhum_TRINITY_DN2162_c0_g1_i1::g.6152::m.6152/K13444/SUMF1, FGE; sulfatase modifying factor 1